MNKHWPKWQVDGLRKRWLVYIGSVVVALGLLCVLGLTILSYHRLYTHMRKELQFQAQTATKLFNSYADISETEFYQTCVAYARSFSHPDGVLLQFLDVNGSLVAASYGDGISDSPNTAEVWEALENRNTQVFVGKNAKGRRIMTVTTPIVYGSGRVIGAFRFCQITQAADTQILETLLLGVCVWILISILLLFTSDIYIRSILTPLAEIMDKAKMITGGSYGIQIQSKHKDEISSLADTINEMSNKLSENEKMQAEFISSLSHELRTPLTAITGWSETLLHSEALDKDASRGVSIILREGKRMTEMVVELLDFTRMQDGRFNLNMELADIRGEFEDTVYMYGSRLLQEGITISYQPDEEEIPQISCDPKRMRQVFLNILDNAAKHGGAGKQIDAAITLEDDFVVVRIRDYGPGIPEDELQLVKKKFYKGSSKARGTGIGLAVCDEIVAMHGGTLKLENAIGGGIEATVSIPVSL